MHSRWCGLQTRGVVVPMQGTWTGMAMFTQSRASLTLGFGMCPLQGVCIGSVYNPDFLPAICSASRIIRPFEEYPLFVDLEV